VDTLLALLAAVIVAVVVLVALRSVIAVVTIHDHERGLRYRNGRFRGLVSSGVYPILRPISDIRVIDARPTWQLLEGQDVPTADGVVVRVSLACRYVVGDPVAAFTGDQDFRRALYLSLQLALRDAFASRTLEQALPARVTIGAEVADTCALELARLGIELLTVQVRDIVVPSELKRAYAGVMAARKEGEAALERARGETAALRHLANAGRLVEESPGLLSLRIVQQLAQSTGNSVVVTLPTGGDARAVPDALSPAAGPAVATRRRARGGDDLGGPDTPLG